MVSIECSANTEDGFAVDVVEGISSSTKLFITGAKSVRDVTVVVDGKYLRLSGYRAGRGLTSRYGKTEEHAPNWAYGFAGP